MNPKLQKQTTYSGFVGSFTRLGGSTTPFGPIPTNGFAAFFLPVDCLAFPKPDMEEK